MDTVSADDTSVLQRIDTYLDDGIDATGCIMPDLRYSIRSVLATMPLNDVLDCLINLAVLDRRRRDDAWRQWIGPEGCLRDVLNSVASSGCVCQDRDKCVTCHSLRLLKLL